MCKLTQKDLLEFELLKEELKSIKTKEIECRNKIINHFRYGDKLEGAVHKSISDSDFDIVVTLKLNRPLDQDAVETLWSEFSQEERDCIKTVYELKVGPYKKLIKSDGVDKLLGCVTEKPGQASLVLKYEE